MLEVVDHFHENGNTIILDCIDDGNNGFSYVVTRKPQGHTILHWRRHMYQVAESHHPSDGTVKKLLEFFIVEMN